MKLTETFVADGYGWRRFTYDVNAHEGDTIALSIADGVLIVTHTDGTVDLCEDAPD